MSPTGLVRKGHGTWFRLHPAKLCPLGALNRKVMDDEVSKEERGAAARKKDGKAKWLKVLKTLNCRRSIVIF
jgi:hypothetical protein